MGRFKDIAIGLMERADQDCPNDEELQVLMDNFKPSLKELQADADILQAHEVILPPLQVAPDIKVYLMMKNGYPIRSYMDRALAFYECWICTKGEEYTETPDDYYIVEIMHDQSIYTGE
jgi:hypothetical protein